MGVSDSPLIRKATSSRDLKDSPVIGTATSYDLKYPPVTGRTSLRDFYRDYDSGVFSDEESSGCSEDMSVPYSAISPVPETVRTHNKDCKFFQMSMPFSSDVFRRRWQKNTKKIN
jgi:hypothetical protein